MLSPWASQASVFQQLSPILEAVLAGFNGTVMAYGQTSAGKVNICVFYLFLDFWYCFYNHLNSLSISPFCF